MKTILNNANKTSEQFTEIVTLCAKLHSMVMFIKETHLSNIFNKNKQQDISKKDKQQIELRLTKKAIKLIILLYIYIKESYKTLSKKSKSNTQLPSLVKAIQDLKTEIGIWKAFFKDPKLLKLNG